MAVEILMPELGESVHEGTVSRWLKKEGDFVKEDEPVVEIMTDKVNTELPSPATGVLSKIVIPEGAPVEVFHVMGIIEEEGASNGAAKPAATSAEPANAEAKPAPAPAPELAKPVVSAEKQWYTPVVRAMAKESQVSDAELATIPGTGPGGRVTKKDVEAYLASGRTANPSAPRVVVPEPKSVQPTVAGVGQTVVPLVGMRKMIAEAMVRSSQVPTVSTVTRCDVTAMVAFRDRNKEAFQEQYGVKLTYTPFFLKAVAESLLEVPLVNASLQPDNNILMNDGIHLGISVALGAKGDEGLIVPVIRDCHKKNLVEIAKDLDSIAKRARANQLSVADVQGGTFTVTNPGTYGAMFGTPMINAPQAGILGTYAIDKEPVIVNDMIAIRSMMHLVLTYDHRIVDGLVAGKFLAAVRDRLQAFDFFK
ncbi:MAG TPA: dihydrolipoamide acetyltransferase family protein [Fimbriimonadaceae bacterium]|nr:dihydrolipoamide acetyltransferase family protein [Fimbriimonadaceae bacterium]